MLCGKTIHAPLQAVVVRERRGIQHFIFDERTPHAVLISVPALPQLLLGVAELELTAAVPPVCLEIAQLCGRCDERRWSGSEVSSYTVFADCLHNFCLVGFKSFCMTVCPALPSSPLRLPLCLNIVGNLIRTFGQGTRGKRQELPLQSLSISYKENLR